MNTYMYLNKCKNAITKYFTFHISLDVLYMYIQTNGNK